MTKRVLLIPFALLGCTAMGCGPERVTSTWLVREISVDGVGEEWDELPLLYVDELAGMAGVANDTAHLYVMFRFNDGQLARRIHFGGLTLWVDPKGGKEKKLGIRLGGPTGRAPRSEGQEREPWWERSREERAPVERGEPPPLPPTEVWLIRGGREERLEAQPSRGPAAAFREFRGGYCIEFRLPFDDAMKPGSDAGVGLELSGLGGEKRRAGDRPGPPGGPGGPGGMGPRRGARPPGGAQPPVMSTTSVWKTVRLVTKDQS